MSVVLKIDTVNEISDKDFKEHYMRPQKPLVIKKLANKYPAGWKWSVSYMKSVCGDVNVDVFDNNCTGHTGSAFTTPDLQMKFSDYIDTLLKDKPSSLRMFLFNMFRHKPELRKDFPCPSIFKGILGRIGYMFFGSKDIKVRVHQDIDFSSVLLTQFHGRKRVVLISPEYSTLLHRLPFNTYSLVDIDNPDYSKFPGLEYVVTQECVLEPGDSLFIPSGYWHYITYLDGGFAVSYRKLAPGITMKLNGFMYFLIYMPIDKMMNKIMGIKWLEKKQRIARARAIKAIQNIELNPGFQL